MEAALEGFGREGYGFDVAEEGGAVELAEERFEGDVDADLEVFVLVRPVDGDAQAQHVGLFLAFELLEVHLAGVEEVAVEADF